MALHSWPRNWATAGLCLSLAGWAWSCSSPNGETGNGSGGSVAKSMGGSSSGGAPTSGGVMTSGGTTSSGGTQPMTSGGVSGASGSSGAMSGGASGASGMASGGSMGGAGAGNAGGGASGASGAAGGGAGGAGGSGGAAELKMPIERNGKYVLEFDTTLFEVDPQLGGRITTFSIDGKNVLATQTVTGDAVNWGSTTWPSPQGNWLDDGKTGDWPPLDWLDSKPYTAKLDGNAIVLTSPDPPASGMQAKLAFVKRFSADLSARAISIEIQINNKDTTTKSWAGWQITRVGPNGLTFYPPMGAPLSNQMMTSDAAGCTWYQHPNGLPYMPSSGTASGAKLIANPSSPWLAHVTNGVLFLQTFPPLGSGMAAPGEGLVEIYAANTKAYEEVEPQSAVMSIEAGKSASWTLRWYLRALPANVMATAGNADLVSFVQGVAK